MGLRGGVEMPIMGLGSSGYNATVQAMHLGYRAFHDALSYGNQLELGAAIKASPLPRKELFIMSMVPKYLMGYNETKAAVAASLEQLGVEYIDLVMIHHRAAAAAEWPRQVKSMTAFPDNWAAPGSPINNGSNALWQPPACSHQD